MAKIKEVTEASLSNIQVTISISKMLRVELSKSATTDKAIRIKALEEPRIQVMAGQI